MARRLKCLQDFAAEGLEALVECGNHNCRRRVIADPRELLDKIKKERWIHVLRVQCAHMVCRECGNKGARIAPLPKFVQPFDCDEFRDEVAKLWTKIMTDSAAASEILSTMAQLCEREINCGIETFWDGGVTAYIGDAPNGRKAQESFPFSRVADIPAWLMANADA